MTPWTTDCQWSGTLTDCEVGVRSGGQTVELGARQDEKQICATQIADGMRLFASVEHEPLEGEMLLWSGQQVHDEPHGDSTGLVFVAGRFDVPPCLYVKRCCPSPSPRRSCCLVARHAGWCTVGKNGQVTRPAPLHRRRRMDRMANTPEHSSPDNAQRPRTRTSYPTSKPRRSKKTASSLKPDAMH